MLLANDRRLYFKYGMASNVLDQQFKLLEKEFSKKIEQDNPIEYLKCRIKSDDSIQEKLIKLRNQGKIPITSLNKNDIFTTEEIENNLHDVVGYRVICPFLCDVKKIIEVAQEFLDVQEEIDYIKNPKTSGYSSYHMKVKVPILMPDTGKTELVKAEVQVRTIIMDMLASLEHKIYYKKNVELTEEMQTKLNKIIEYCNLVEEDLNKVILQEKRKRQTPRIYKPLPKFMKTEEFKENINYYEEALKKVNQKIELLNEQYSSQPERKPIEHTKSRIKSNSRIVEKLQRQNIPVNLENINKYVNDIAGLRIVCSFLDDAEEVIKTIKQDKELKIIEEQDYMINPKENGYSSYHILVLVPVETNNGIIDTKVEIQIRTMPGETWALLQERLCYQKKVNKEITDNLKRLAEVLTEVDYNMNEMIRASLKQQEEKKKILVKY